MLQTFIHFNRPDPSADCYICTVQELLGHKKDVKTTMIYTHVLNRGRRGVRSPLDLV
jgi:integrase